MRCRIPLGLLIGPILALSSLAGASELPQRGQIVAFTEKHCLACHDSATKKGGLDLQSLSTDLSEKKFAARWQEIHDRVVAGEMPPADSERPAAEASQAFTQAIAKGLIDQELSERQINGPFLYVVMPMRLS